MSVAAKSVAHDPETIRSRVRALVAAHGVAPTARLLGMSRHAILGLTGPGVVHAGTVALARERLASAPTLGVTSVPSITA